MAPARTILILGASYGSLLATKLLLAGQNVSLVCLPEEAELINREGTLVRLSVKGRDRTVEIRSRKLPGKLDAMTPAAADPRRFDLIALAMQEPQYGAGAVRELLARVAPSGKPVMSIMNMPPLPYFARIPGVDLKLLEPCYADPRVWDGFTPRLFTLASPDPQAFRPPEEPLNHLQVTLPTNFKVARFDDPASTAMLRQLEAAIEAVRFDPGDGPPVELPVKLKVHDSVFVPMAKWSMLLTGNYRCVGTDDMRSIREAVHSDLAASLAVYEWVGAVCRAIGASDADLVPFEKYANAALSLGKPSSAARALAGGATRIERVDLLVQTLAASRGMRNQTLDATVALVDDWLARNRIGKSGS